MLKSKLLLRSFDSQSIRRIVFHSLTEVFGKFILANRAAILSSGRSAHGQCVKDDVFGFVEEIALAILVANQ